MIITRTPFRISFFGGGTDYPKWYREHGGAVLATTIDKYCYLTCRRLPPFFEHKHRIVYSRIENVRTTKEIEHPAVRAVFDWTRVEEGLEIHHDGDLPARSGLGSSSSFTVGLLHALRALNGRMVDKETLAREAIHVEQEIIQENVGSQDQISAAFGGFNRIEFKRNNSFDVAPVILPEHRQQQLNKHLMLFFTGVSRNASDIAKSKIDNITSRGCELNYMRSMVDQGTQILQGCNQSLDEFGALLHDSWQYKRQLSEKVSTPHIDHIYEEARTAGAIGGKILGAGGGGFMLFFARPEVQGQIRKRLSSLVHVPFKFDDTGSRVVLYQPNGL
jgi:D-glycero-alpha-D-manno-heptose-7-phosphate kinase